MYLHCLIDREIPEAGWCVGQGHDDLSGLDPTRYAESSRMVQVVVLRLRPVSTPM